MTNVESIFCSSASLINPTILYLSLIHTSLKEKIGSFDYIEYYVMIPLSLKYFDISGF